MLAQQENKGKYILNMTNMDSSLFFKDFSLLGLDKSPSIPTLLLLYLAMWLIGL